MWIPFGTIARPHGVRGELRVVLFHPGDELPRLRRAQLLRPSGPEEVVVAGLRPGSGALLLRLAGVDSREAADGLRGCVIAVAREDLPSLAPGEFYLHELLGASLRDETGRQLGTLESIADNMGQDLATIRTADGTRLLPLVAGTVRHFDRDAHVAVINLIEGLW